MRLLGPSLAPLRVEAKELPSAQVREQAQELQALRLRASAMSQSRPKPSSVSNLKNLLRLKGSDVATAAPKS